MIRAGLRQHRQGLLHPLFRQVQRVQVDEVPAGKLVQLDVDARRGEHIARAGGALEAVLIAVGDEHAQPAAVRRRGLVKHDVGQPALIEPAAEHDDAVDRLGMTQAGQIGHRRPLAEAHQVHQPDVVLRASAGRSGAGCRRC